MKELVKDPTIALLKTPLDQKANKKTTHVFLSIICEFF